MSAQALEIRINNNARQVEIDWDDGRPGRYGFELLRQSCRCSECRSYAILNGHPVAITTELGMAGISPVGRYAVQLHFSDGHDRGIFPFAYLRGLASG